MPTQIISGGAAFGGTYPQRRAQIARYARQLPPVEQKAFIAELEGGSLQDQHLGGLAAVATQNTDWIARHVAHETPSLQHVALRSSHLLPDDVIEDALAGDISDFGRRALIRYGLENRPKLADKVLPSLRKTWGDRLAVRVLVHCTPQTVRQHLRDLLPAASATSIWRSLAKRHSDILLDALEAGLEDAVQSGISANTWWELYGVAVAVLLKSDEKIGTRVLDMVDKYKLRQFPRVLTRHYSIFARLSPSRLLEYLRKRSGWVITGPNVLSRSIMRRMSRATLHSPALYDYAQYKAGKMTTPGWGGAEDLLKSIAPRDRLPIYKAMNLNGLFLDLLPRQQQIEVATAVLEEQEHKETETLAELKLVSYLEPKYARPKLEGFMTDHDMTVRSGALSCLVRNAARCGSGSVWDSTLKELGIKLRNQPQPVREPVIKTLCSVSSHLWNARSLSTLGEIGKDALDASDHVGAKSLLVSFALKTMRLRPELEDPCLDFLLKINKIETVSLHEKVRYSQVIKVFETLASDIKANVARGEVEPALHMAGWVGKQLRDIPELQGLLWDITQRRGTSRDSAARALTSLIAVDQSYAVKAVEEERSTLTFKSVADTIAKYRPELLDLGSPPTGRWLEDATDWTLPCEPSLSRYWPEDQFQIYLDQIRRDLEVGDLRSRARSMRKLKHVPGGIAVAKSYALGDSVILAEAALSVLSHNPQELSTLLNFASTNSARVAVYCAGRAAKHLPTSVLQPMLADALTRETTKVTGKKQLLRLIACLLPVSVAERSLSDAVNAPRVQFLPAATSVALGYLQSRPSGWDIVEAAASKDSEAALVVAEFPVLLIHDRARYARLIISLTTSDNENVAYKALTCLPLCAPFEPKAWSILRDVLTDMSRKTKTWRSAATALVLEANNETAKAALCEALRVLLSMEEDPKDNAGEFEDLPISRRVQLIALRMSQNRSDLEAYEPAMRAVLHVIDTSGNPNYERECCQMLLSLWNDDLGVLHAAIQRLQNRPVQASQLADDFASLLEQRSQRGAFEVASELADGGYIEALFALSIVRRMTLRPYWGKEWVDIGRKLRAHPNVEIRDLARHIKLVQQLAYRYSSQCGVYMQ